VRQLQVIGMRRRSILALVSGLILAPRLLFAQERAKLARIGYLGPARAASFAPRVEALRAGLRELGYIEGVNLSFEFRWAESPSQMPELAAELVRAGVDVIFAHTSTETAAALATTKTVPVVFAAHADPVGVGHVASLARPGGNATGLTMLLTEVAAKELEALREALPNAKRFGVLFTSTAPSHIPALEAVETAARSLAVELRRVPISGEEDLQAAFATMTRDGVEAFIVLASSFTLSRRALIADLAIKHRLPSVFGAKDNVRAGGLMSYAPDATTLTRRAATYVHRILKGEKPADLPVEQATRYELSINLKTAAALGLTIPPNLLARADEVIE
jgi:putative tryptophan/tyrosine transport system substrate-binding protein